MVRNVLSVKSAVGEAAAARATGPSDKHAGGKKKQGNCNRMRDITVSLTALDAATLEYGSITKEEVVLISVALMEQLSDPSAIP